MTEYILSIATLSLLLGLGVMIEFFGFYVRGGFASIVIHFLGISWFFIWGTQVANWSQLIAQLLTTNGVSIIVDTIPNQPFILIFPFMVLVALAGMLDAINGMIYGEGNTADRENRSSIITKRNPNRGL